MRSKTEVLLTIFDRIMDLRKDRKRSLKFLSNKRLKLKVMAGMRNQRAGCVLHRALVCSCGHLTRLQEALIGFGAFCLDLEMHCHGDTHHKHKHATSL